MKYLTGIQLNKLIVMLEQDPLEYPITTGVLDGTFNGFALADDQDNPSKALVFHNLVGFLHYIGAQPTQSEARELASKALSYKSERNYYKVVEFTHCHPIRDLIEKKEHKI